jgi:hypothetical protein
MTQYHISSDGSPGRCKAQIEPCPLKGRHYPSLKDARDAAKLEAQVEAHARQQRKERLAGITELDVPGLRKMMEEDNTSGDMLFVPESLRIYSRKQRNGEYITGSFVGAEDGVSYSMHMKPGEFMMVFKGYDDEPITEAQPYMKKAFSELSLADVFSKPQTSGWASEVVSFNLLNMFEAIQEPGRNWNQDTDTAKFMYFGEAFEDINSSLRNGTSFNPEFIQTLDNVMVEHELTEPVTVWRGMRVKDPETQAKFMSGKYADPAYLSTSPDESVARGFGGGGNRPGLLMKLTLPAGTKCHQAVNSLEPEITLPRGYDLSGAEWEILGK